MSFDTAAAFTPKVNIPRVRAFLEQALAERQAIIRESAPTAAPNVDPVSWATSTASKRVMDQIVAAMERLDAGTYGRCVRCGEAIPVARLDVLPYAENCIDCQRGVDRP